MLPLQDNNYIHAVRQHWGGKIIRASDVSKFFSVRLTLAQEDAGLSEGYPISQELIISGNYKLDLEREVSDNAGTLGFYQYWGDINGAGFNVDGEGVISVGSGFYLLPSGAEVTVSQNGSLTVPSEENFVPIGEMTLFWVFEIDGDFEALPYNGKLWFGNLHFDGSSASGTDPVALALVKADGTYNGRNTMHHSEDSQPVLFTHLFNDNDDQEIYFSGKEFDVKVEGQPTASTPPDITFVPD